MRCLRVSTCSGRLIGSGIGSFCTEVRSNDLEKFFPAITASASNATTVVVGLLPKTLISMNVAVSEFP